MRARPLGPVDAESTNRRPQRAIVGRGQAR
jgi:hypothetical protein